MDAPDEPANDNDETPTEPLIPIREETGLPPPRESGVRWVLDCLFGR
jgi:hypothetical protein